MKRLRKQREESERLKSIIDDLKDKLELTETDLRKSTTEKMRLELVFRETQDKLKVIIKNMYEYIHLKRALKRARRLEPLSSNPNRPPSEIWKSNFKMWSWKRRMF